MGPSLYPSASSLSISSGGGATGEEGAKGAVSVDAGSAVNLVAVLLFAEGDCSPPQAAVAAA